MKEITLSNTDKVTLVDDEDYERLNGSVWRMENGYARTGRHNPGRPAPAMHRVVLGEPIGGPNVDHINGDRLDNRKSNLRWCTTRQNCQNIRRLRGGKLGPKLPTGVGYTSNHSNRNKPFRSYIRIGEKRVFLGYFATPHEASAAYEAAVVRFGIEQSFSA